MGTQKIKGSSMTWMMLIKYLPKVYSSPIHGSTSRFSDGSGRFFRASRGLGIFLETLGTCPSRCDGIDHDHRSSYQSCPHWMGTVMATVPAKLIWLVVWNIWIIFPYIGNVIIPIDERIFLRGVAQPPTSHTLW